MIVEATVTELLRDFGRIRREAMAGKRVIIRTKEGNLVLLAEKPPPRSLFGALSESIDSGDLEPSESGLAPDDWGPSL